MSDRYTDPDPPHWSTAHAGLSQFAYSEKEFRHGMSRRTRRRMMGRAGWDERHGQTPTAPSEKICPVCGEAYVDTLGPPGERAYVHDPEALGLHGVCIPREDEA